MGSVFIDSDPVNTPPPVKINLGKTVYTVYLTPDWSSRVFVNMCSGTLDWSSRLSGTMYSDHME